MKCCWDKRNIMLLNCTIYMYMTSLLDAVGWNRRTLTFVTKWEMNSPNNCNSRRGRTQLCSIRCICVAMLCAASDYSVWPCTSVDAVRWSRRMTYMHVTCSVLLRSLPHFVGCTGWWRRKLTNLLKWLLSSPEDFRFGRNVGLSRWVHNNGSDTADDVWWR